jgi:RimJ/RimL family protein N-acetyltransferase
MTNYPTLENEWVRLSPLSLDNYQYLLDIASEENLVQYSPSAINSPNNLKNYTELALKHRDAKTAIPFIIFDKLTNTFVGCTRFMNIHWVNKTLEIGSTWIGRKYQGTGVNTHAKAMMLAYAFNEMGMEKVEFRIDERNTPSRKAVEKLGCTLEGILRENVYLKDGFKRNTCYGLLKKEWKELLT